MYIFWRLASCEPPARSSCESLLHCTVLSISSHSLTNYHSHLNIGLLIAKLQANLARNKAKRWLIKSNLTHGLLIYSILLDRIVLGPYAFQVFCIQWSYCVVVFSGDTCFYGLRASQILKLGVSEFCSTVLNSRVKSRVCFRVLSQNNQRGRFVRFNLINHFVGFSLCQFACNSAQKPCI